METFKKTQLEYRKSHANLANKVKQLSSRQYGITIAMITKTHKNTTKKNEKKSRVAKF